MIEYSIKNPLVTNFLLLSIVMVGVLSWYAMPQEMFPVVELDRITVETEYEGAPPVEVERQLTIPIEDEIDDIAEIDELQSISREGQSRILLRLKPDINVDETVRNVRFEVDAVEDLPEDSETARVTRLKRNFPVISVSVYGDVSEAELIRSGKLVERELKKIEGVGSVNIAGERDTEVWVIVDPYEIAAKNVSLEEIRVALAANLKDRPGGSLSAVEGDIQLRGVGIAENVQAVEAIPIRTNSDGAQLRVGDIAEVRMELEQVQTRGRFSGLRSLNLIITKDMQASTAEIAGQVKKLITEKLPALLPPAVQLGYHSDFSVYIDTRLQTVFSSGLIGLVLLLLSLYLLLNIRVALITALGIPVSFLVAVIFINYLGFTINMVSLFAFLIALGMIVDDAIIITENIHHYVEEGMPVKQAALLGTREVVGPVIAATLTTIVAFLPMFAIGGVMGSFIKVIPVVVSAALLGSLLEAFLVLPAHAHAVLKPTHHNATTKQPQTKHGFVDWNKFLKNYQCYLEWSLNNRYLIWVIASCVLVLTLVIATTRVPFQLFVHVEVDEFFVNIEAPSNYSIEETEVLATEIEKKILSVFEGNEHELNTLLTNVGVILTDDRTSGRSKVGDNYVQFIVALTKREPRSFIERYIVPLVSFNFSAQGQRKRSVDDIAQIIRQQVSHMPGVKRFSILRPEAGPAGADIEISIAGDELDRLNNLADEMVEFLRTLSGVYDVRHDLDMGKLEVRYQLNELGKRLGVTQQQIADALRTGYFGVEAVQVNWGDERYPVRVIFDQKIRHDSSRLANLPLILGGGKIVYLNEIADLNFDRSFNQLNRLDGRRIVTVTAEVDTKEMAASQVYDYVANKFNPIYDERPGYDMVFRGEKKQTRDSFEGTFVAGVVAIMAILLILLVLFRSLLEPILVILTIPFGIIGVIFGHYLLGHYLQFVSVVGLVALSGIIVNDSLIMLNQIKKRRSSGDTREQAVVSACCRRARPIILTTVTTFLGVSPLIFFATGQTAFLSPMAISLGFGLIAATVLILTVLPCVYLIADDLKEFVFRNLRRLAA